MSNVDMNAPDYIPAKKTTAKKSLLMLISVRGTRKTAVKK